MKYLGTLMKNWILFVTGTGIATSCGLDGPRFESS